MEKKKNSLRWSINKYEKITEKKLNKESFQVNIQNLMNMMEQFINDADIKENSKKTYFKGLKKFIEWLINENEENESITLSKSIIINYKIFLSEHAHIKPHTQAVYLVSIKQFFIWAESNLIFPNIARNIKGIKKITKQHHKDPLSQNQMAILLHPSENIKKKEAIIEIRNISLINLLLFTGIRIGEITKIKIGDIEKSHIDKNTTIWIHGKGRSGKDSFIIAMDHVMEKIENYIQGRKMNGEIISEQSFLFISHGRKTKNLPLTSDGISKIVNKELTKRNIKTKKTSAHSLRHTFGINAIESGVSLYDLQIAMRHSTPNTTQVYLGDIEKIKRKQGITEEKVFEHIYKKSTQKKDS